MPQVVALKGIFQTQYSILGAIKTDRHMIPHYNSSETLSLLPGEPFLRPWGDKFWVCFAQSLIQPGETKSVLLNFNATFPCNFSADVKDGDEVWWNPTDNEATLEADSGADGFLLGIATFSIDCAVPPTAEEDDYPIVATTESTRVQVVSTGEPNVGVSS